MIGISGCSSATTWANQAVDGAGHPDVGDDEVDAAAVFQHGVGVQSIAGRRHLEARLFERHDEMLDDQLLVVDDEHSLLLPGQVTSRLAA